MGQSLISAAQKSALQDKFHDIHETFARPITIYKTAKQTVVYTSPDNNFLFQGAPGNDVVSEVIQSGVFNARILYAKKEEFTNFDDKQGSAGGGQMILRQKQGEVRIKLDPTGAAFIDGCERITFDGTVFQVLTDVRPQGLFTPDFYSYYLKKLN